MQILMIEDNPEVVRRFKAAFRAHMPNASLDVASGEDEFDSIIGIRGYDAYIATGFVSQRVDGRAVPASTRGMLNKIKEENPSAIIIHNSREGGFDPLADNRQALFARERPCGPILLCKGDPMHAITFLKAMVVMEGGVPRLRPPKNCAPVPNAGMARAPLPAKPPI